MKESKNELKANASPMYIEQFHQTVRENSKYIVVGKSNGDIAWAVEEQKTKILDFSKRYSS